MFMLIKTNGCENTLALTQPEIIRQYQNFKFDKVWNLLSAINSDQVGLGALTTTRVLACTLLCAAGWRRFSGMLGGRGRG